MCFCVTSSMNYTHIHASLKYHSYHLAGIQCIANLQLDFAKLVCHCYTLLGATLALLAQSYAMWLRIITMTNLHWQKGHLPLHQIYSTSGEKFHVFQPSFRSSEEFSLCSKPRCHGQLLGNWNRQFFQPCLLHVHIVWNNFICIYIHIYLFNKYITKSNEW